MNNSYSNKRSMRNEKRGELYGGAAPVTRHGEDMNLCTYQNPRQAMSSQPSSFPTQRLPLPSPPPSPPPPPPPRSSCSSSRGPPSASASASPSLALRTRKTAPMPSRRRSSASSESSTAILRSRSSHTTKRLYPSIDDLEDDDASEYAYQSVLKKMTASPSSRFIFRKQPSSRSQTTDPTARTSLSSSVSARFSSPMSSRKGASRRSGAVRASTASSNDAAQYTRVYSDGKSKSNINNGANAGRGRNTAHASRTQRTEAFNRMAIYEAACTPVKESNQVSPTPKREMETSLPEFQRRRSSKRLRASFVVTETMNKLKLSHLDSDDGVDGDADNDDDDDDDDDEEEGPGDRRQFPIRSMTPSQLQPNPHAYRATATAPAPAGPHLLPIAIGVPSQPTEQSDERRSQRQRRRERPPSQIFASSLEDPAKHRSSGSFQIDLPHEIEQPRQSEYAMQRIAESGSSKWPLPLKYDSSTYLNHKLPPVAKGKWIGFADKGSEKHKVRPHGKASIRSKGASSVPSPMLLRRRSTDKDVHMARKLQEEADKERDIYEKGQQMQMLSTAFGKTVLFVSQIMDTVQKVYAQSVSQSTTPMAKDDSFDPDNTYRCELVGTEDAFVSWVEQFLDAHQACHDKARPAAIDIGYHIVSSLDEYEEIRLHGVSPQQVKFVSSTSFDRYKQCHQRGQTIVLDEAPNDSPTFIQNFDGGIHTTNNPMLYLSEAGATDTSTPEAPTTPVNKADMMCVLVVRLKGRIGKADILRYQTTDVWNEQTGINTTPCHTTNVVAHVACTRELANRRVADGQSNATGVHDAGSNAVLTQMYRSQLLLRDTTSAMVVNSPSSCSFDSLCDHKDQHIGSGHASYEQVLLRTSAQCLPILAFPLYELISTTDPDRPLDFYNTPIFQYQEKIQKTIDSFMMLIL